MTGTRNNLTAGMASEVVKQVMSPLVFCKLSFDSGDLNLWSGLGTLTWGGEDYTGAGWLAQVSAIIETGAIEANGATLTLSGVPTALIALALEQNYQGRSAKLWLAALDNSYALIADPYLILAGYMDVMTLEEGGDTAAISITIENNLLSLQRANERRYTNEDQKKNYPTDTFFSRIDKLQDQVLKFGGAG